MQLKILVDYEMITKTVLLAFTGLTALVAGRIFSQFPSGTPTFPLVTFALIDTFHVDSDYFGNQAMAESVEMEIQSWNAKNVSPIATAIQVDTAMAADGWNRGYSQNFVDPTNGYRYNVARYTKRFS